MSDTTFEGVADTLYIPLAARVYASKSFPDYFFDPKSLEMESAIPGESIQAGCELIEVRPFYADARRILKGKVGLYAKVAMAIVDRTGRAFLLHMKP